MPPFFLKKRREWKLNSVIEEMHTEGMDYVEREPSLIYLTSHNSHAGTSLEGLFLLILMSGQFTITKADLR